MKVHFQGINSLRFFAALSVIIYHIEGFKSTDLKTVPFLRNMGPHGVSFFFVLSGFLITYLLLVEKETYGSISIRKFYTRRALRIWPLYYFIVIVGLYVIPQIPFLRYWDNQAEMQQVISSSSLLCFLLLPNVAEAINTMPYIGNTWSIGVEEQFYFLWPWLIRYTKKYFRLLFLVIIVMILIRVIIILLMNRFPNAGLGPLLEIFVLLRFDAMATGGIAACLLFYKKEKILQFIYRRDVQWLCLGLTFLLLYIETGNRIHFYGWYYFLFAIIILNVATGTKPLFRLRQKWLDYLGKISFGIYIYHPIVIFFCLKMLKPLIVSTYFFNGLLYISSVAGTIFISAISFHGFELFFLRLKKYFVMIETIET